MRFVIFRETQAQVHGHGPGHVNPEQQLFFQSNYNTPDSHTRSHTGMCLAMCIHTPIRIFTHISIGE